MLSAAWRRRLLLASLTLALAGELTACDLGPTPPATGGGMATVAAAAHRSFLNVNYCVSTSASYDHDAALAANRYLADSLDAAIQPNSDGLVAYVTLIGPHIEDASATPITLRAEAIPNYPPSPTLQPTVTPNTQDPYKTGQENAKVQQANDRTLATYKEQLAAVQRQLDQTRAAVKQQTDALRRLDPPRANTPSSPWGCLEIAAHRFGGWQGEKWVVIAAPLDGSWQDYTGALLFDSPTHLRVIFAQCPSPSICQAREASLASAFRRVPNLSDWLFYDVGESRALAPLAIFGAAPQARQ
jgi:hypothetical protein